MRLRKKGSFLYDIYSYLKRKRKLAEAEREAEREIAKYEAD